MQVTQKRGGGGGGGGRNDGSAAISRSGGAPASPQGNSGAKATAPELQIQAMPAEERRATQKLQAEIQSLRKECDRMMQASADLQEQNDELEDRMHELGLQKDSEMAQVSQELLQASAQIAELQEEISQLKIASLPRKAESPLHSPLGGQRRTPGETPSQPLPSKTTCRKCESEIEEPLCAECFTSLLPKVEGPASPSVPAGAQPNGAARLAMKARMVSRFAIASPKPVTMQIQLPGREATSADSSRKEVSPARASTKAASTPPVTPKPPVASKKKQWSYERDIEQWREHCDKLIAKEREDCKAKLNEKAADLAELFEFSFEGRKDIYAQLVDMERLDYYWLHAA